MAKKKKNTLIYNIPDFMWMTRDRPCSPATTVDDFFERIDRDDWQNDELKIFLLNYIAVIEKEAQELLLKEGHDVTDEGNIFMVSGGSDGSIQSAAKTLERGRILKQSLDGDNMCFAVMDAMSFIAAAFRTALMEASIDGIKKDIARKKGSHSLNRPKGIWYAILSAVENFPNDTARELWKKFRTKLKVANQKNNPEEPPFEDDIEITNLKTGKIVETYQLFFRYDHTADDPIESGNLCQRGKDGKVREIGYGSFKDYVTDAKKYLRRKK